MSPSADREPANLVHAMDSTTTATTITVKMGDASLKRKRETYAPKGSRIVIELPSKPRDYQPGSGPPLQRIGLLPAQDSTAYIIERILLPPAGLAADGKPLPKRMTYIVGWHDLPAARMLVPAMEVLEYVSPRALEDWEYKMEMDLDEERARLEAEKQRAKAGSKAVQDKAQTTKPKRKRVKLPAHSQIEIAVVAEPNNEALKTGRPSTGAMSLTTPSKKRVRDLGHVSDEEESPSRQLEREAWQSSVDATTREGSMMDVDSVAMDSERSRAVTREPSAESFGPRGMGGLYKEETLSRVCDLPPKSSLGTAAVLPSSVASEKETPIPLPKIPGLITSQAIGPQWSVQRTPSTSVGACTSFKSSNPNTPTLSKETPFTSTATRPKPTPKTKDTPSQKPKKERQKPAAAPKPPPPPQEPQQQSSSADADAALAEAVWEVKRVEAVELYEVEGVGLVRYFKVLWEGDWPPDQNPSWEPEENLPASLVRNFFKRGKKRRSAAAAPAAAPKPKKALAQQSIVSWATAGAKYKSVSEAFAGGEDDADLLGSPADAQGHVHQEEEEDGYGVEEFLVVAEPPPPKKSRKQGSVG